MRRHPPRLIELSRRARVELEALAHNGCMEQRVARRARVLLAMAQPETLVQELAERVEMSPHGIWYLCRRFDERGLEAVWDAPRSGRPGQFPPPLQRVQIEQLACCEPMGLGLHLTHWSTRSLMTFWSWPKLMPRQSGIRAGSLKNSTPAPSLLFIRPRGWGAVVLSSWIRRLKLGSVCWIRSGCKGLKSLVSMPYD
jgi:hypothetical protein